MKKHVAVASEISPMYSFFLPFQQAMWSERGWVPIFNLVGTREEWAQHPALFYVDPNNIRYHAHTTEFPAGTQAQLTRLFMHRSLSSSDDYIMTTDVDMLPLSRSYWDGDVTKLNVYKFSGNDQAFMCYVGGPRRLWEQLIPADWSENRLLNDRFAHIQDGMRKWCFDEDLLNERMAVYSGPKVVTDRPLGLGCCATGRADRAIWDESWENATIDAHCPRGSELDTRWRTLRLLILNHSDNRSQIIDWIDTYWSEFKSWSSARH